MFKKADNSSVWRTFNGYFPKELIPVYDFLQKELDLILLNKDYRTKLELVDVTQSKGKVVTDIEHILFDSYFVEDGIKFNKNTNTEEIKYKKIDRINLTKNWNLGGNSWYLRILIDNIKNTLTSLHEKKIIYSLLKRNNNKIDSNLREQLTNLKLFPTNAELKNIQRSNNKPELPRNRTFELDFALWDKTMFLPNNNKYSCKIRTSKTNWINYSIYIPYSIRPGFTGEIANPKFVKRSNDGEYVALIAYKVKKLKSTANNILGVDQGKIKDFSAVIYYPDTKSYSKEYVCNNSYNNINNSLDSLYLQKQRLKEKIIRTSNYFDDKDKTSFLSKTNQSKYEKRLLNYISIVDKISNLKKTKSTNIASDLVQLAIDNDCSKIKIENLSNIENTGHWNYSYFSKRLKEIAELYGIKVIEVNPYNTSKEHPITKEVGRQVGRDVIFNDGYRIDRDVLAAINIAIRKENKDGTDLEIKNIRKTHTKTPKKFNKRLSNKKQTLKQKGKINFLIFPSDTKIVCCPSINSCLKHTMFHKTLWRHLFIKDSFINEQSNSLANKLFKLNRFLFKSNNFNIFYDY